LSRIKNFPKKSLGQNYLIDENICSNIVNSFNIKKDDCVIEIGPGQGALTALILKNTGKLTVVELDKANCIVLNEKLPGLNIINKDFLNFDLKKQFEICGSKLRIIGNIPYNITSEIIFKLIDSRKCVSDAQLMVQEEVAHRIAAKPGGKEYGIPSVLVQVFSKPTLMFKVSKNCFYPRPKVDSRIIHFDFNNSLEDKINNIEFFMKFVRAAFATRRKTLKNSLKSLGIDLNNVDFDFSRRAETLSVSEFIELSNMFN
jgi:16S rRNA (adenine1518-N6/adenine1519-N6)-dimethyltransferase